MDGTAVGETGNYMMEEFDWQRVCLRQTRAGCQTDICFTENNSSLHRPPPTASSFAVAKLASGLRVSGRKIGRRRRTTFSPTVLFNYDQASLFCLLAKQEADGRPI